MLITASDPGNIFHCLLYSVGRRLFTQDPYKTLEINKRVRTRRKRNLIFNLTMENIFCKISFSAFNLFNGNNTNYFEEAFRLRHLL